MSETLCSVGLDVGTTSTQLIVSELTVQNSAGAFSVPEMTISDRNILYESPVYLTPLLGEDRIDGQGIRQIVEREYDRAGITRQKVQTGAVIITGETSRKENAQAVLSALSDYAGDFVVATAGPDLESRLAAKGAGAAAYSEKTGKTVLHMDIGGGTSNLALIENGVILDTGCLNVGGRLVKYSEDGRILWVSRVLDGMFSLQPGQTLREEQAEKLAGMLTEVLEMAVGLRPPDERLAKLITKEGKLLNRELLQSRPVLSFSGGVADCIERIHPWKQVGDLGPLLGKAIRNSRLCQGEYLLGKNPIRATVIGAGCHAAQLSGSTVFYQNIRFPLKNIRVIRLPPVEKVSETQIRESLQGKEEPVVLAFGGSRDAGYDVIRTWAEKIARGAGTHPLLICLQQDMAKALGQALALRMGAGAEILCMDRIVMGEDSYLDVGEPVGPAIPVVVKTLILGKG